MKKKSKKRKGINTAPSRCPYCGGKVIYRSADGIYQDNSRGTMLYVCSNYPECDAYVRTHTGTRMPVGTMANHELRMLRKTAHSYFDRLYKTGLMTKDEAYVWLANLIDAPLSQAHIGYLGEYHCGLVIEQCKLYLHRHNKNQKTIRYSKEVQLHHETDRTTAKVS